VLSNNKKTKIIFDCCLTHYLKTNKMKMHGIDTYVVHKRADW